MGFPLNEKIKRLEILVKDVQANVCGSQQKLIENIQDDLYKHLFFLSSGQKEQTEDLLQESLVKILLNIKKLKEPKTFVAWSYKIAFRTFLSHKRKKWTQIFNKKSELEDLESAVSGDSDEDRIVVHLVLSKLSHKDRHLLVLIDIEGVSYEDAAKITGLKLNTLKTRVRRSREAFKKIWDELDGQDFK